MSGKSNILLGASFDTIFICGKLRLYDLLDVRIDAVQDLDHFLRLAVRRDASPLV